MKILETCKPGSVKQMKVSRLLFQWFLVFFSFSLNLTAETKPRVNNYAKDFEEFWIANRNMDAKQQLAAIKKDFFPKFKVFYDFKLEKWIRSGKNPDEEILKQLDEFKSIQIDFIAKSRSIASDIEKNLPAFLAFFPDFDRNFDIYITHSLGEMDGGTRIINGKLYFIFGVDGIVKYHKGVVNDVPFFHHELFHVYHFPRLVQKNEIWVSLWAEGLATLVSEMMNPGSSLDDLMLDTPRGLYESCEKIRPQLMRRIESKLTSSSGEEYERYFLLSSQDDKIPKRAGYYIGYQVAKELSRKYSIQQMANLDEKVIIKEMKSSIKMLKERNVR